MSTTGYGVHAQSDTSIAVYALSLQNWALHAQGPSGHRAYLAGSAHAADFYGDVQVNGNLTKSSGSFKIDHPLDPAGKYLYHSFVESPDMKNIYDGVVELDGAGEAVVELPEWFEALNRDFRYQLTAVGGAAPNLHIAEEISNNQFKIAGGRAGMKVSWMVTGIRQDPYANAHRIPVEEEKVGKEAGRYIYPELFGEPREKSIHNALHPEMSKELGAGKQTE